MIIMAAQSCCSYWLLVVWILVTRSRLENHVSAATVSPEEVTAPDLERLNFSGVVDISGSVTGSVKPASIYQTAQFVTPHSNGSFRHMAISPKTQDVFIGAVDYLYRLDADLKLLEEVKTGPNLDSHECPPPTNHKRVCPSERFTNNFNKVLLVDQSSDRLISCGTLYHGYCERRHLANISRLEPPDVRVSVVNNNASTSTVAFIAPGPLGVNVLYVSVTWSATDMMDIPAVASRNLTSFNLAHQGTFSRTAVTFESLQRQQFPVQYVYGFSSDNYSYTLAVQKKQLGAGLHSVAIRLCQSDMNYYSYVEMPLTCTHRDRGSNFSFSILTAAHLGRLGRNMALLLGVNTQTDVLLTVLSRGANFSGPGSSQALCVFRMSDVKAQFTETINRCVNGDGSTGGGHLGPSKPCSQSSLDHTCGETDSNFPISGTTPIEGQAVYIFPPYTATVTALTVTPTHHYTVAFVGSKDGDIHKLSLDSSTSSNMYETLSVEPHHLITPDISFDGDGEHVYALTDKKVVKLKVQNCGQYTNCYDCLAAQDPFCGWCFLENRCMQQKDCRNSDLSKRWLPFDSHECPRISRIIPGQIQRDKPRLLTLDIQHLPDFQILVEYKCVFTSLVTSPNVSLSVVANRTSGSSLQCYTPSVALLPAFEKGGDSVDMRLVIQMNEQELVYEKVTFFDCGVHTSCSACTLSSFPCTWCVKKHMCTDNTDQHCNTDVLITGTNKSGISSTPGPAFCPRVEPMDAETEILVAAGSRVSIEVKGRSLQSFQLGNIRCQFNGIMEVNATATLLHNLDYIITCKEFEFDYTRDTQFKTESLKIVWGGGDHALDNNQGITVVVFKCDSMAYSCGECLTVDPKFRCGWCNDANCVVQSLCQGDFLQMEAVCPNPQILSFTPKSGPTQGGTILTIQGKNLGSSVDEVQVGIDNIKCHVMELRSHERIVCRTEISSFVLADKVKAIIGRTGNQFMAESYDQFRFVKPTVSGVYPSLGPQAGGTVITLVGQHLDAGSNLSIIVGGKYLCLQPESLNTSAVTCLTSAAEQPDLQALDITIYMDDAVLQSPGVNFRYMANPNITEVSRNMIIRSGGLQMNVTGENLHVVQSPRIVIWKNGDGYYGSCDLINGSSTAMNCTTPYIGGLEEHFDGFQELDFGFLMDGVQELLRLNILGKMKVHPDPVLEKLKDGEKIHQQTQDILFLKGYNLAPPLRQEDISVWIGQEPCHVNSVIDSVITCRPPAQQPAALDDSSFPDVIVNVGNNLTFNLGALRYEKQEDLSSGAITGIIVAVIIVIIVSLVVCVVCCIKSRRNDDMMKKMKKEMDQLESRVANECKEAFAELQTDMSELTSNLSGSTSIPFWDYRMYCMRVLFPPDLSGDHPVIKDLEFDYHRKEDVEHGLKLFFNLIRNKTFLLIFVRTLEANKEFSMKERVNVASLLSVCLQTQMEYATDILKTLLAELIERTIENPPKISPKILLRRNESVAEKMLTNWFTFLLYRFLKECAGEPLFMLYGAIKQQVSKGPVDAVTSEARYSLSEDKLLRQQISYKSLVLHVMDVDVDRCSQPSHPVKVLDCDTISQVKEKILDALYKSAPFSSRPPKEELDVVLFEHTLDILSGDKSHYPLKIFPNKDSRHLVLSDVDHTTRVEGDYRVLNTLSHYKVPDGAFVSLQAKQTSMYNLHLMSDKNKLIETQFYNRSTQALNRNIHHPSNMYSGDSEGGKVYHLVRQQDSELGNTEGERGNKMVSEIYLPRLLVTKGTLQTFVDELFERIFSTAHRGTALPLAIKYMFDFLDDQALLHGMDDEVVHIWKSNSLPLRFWVNVIKNPNFAFDIYKSNIVDACLTVIGQTFMDSCSTAEQKLTKDSPSGKLLFAKDIPKYRQWVARYYQDIKIMPAISDQDMTAMLAEESRIHQNEFNTNAALMELYKYVHKHFDEIMNALEDDEFAKKSRLTYKLDQVSSVLDSVTNC